MLKNGGSPLQTSLLDTMWNFKPEHDDAEKSKLKQARSALIQNYLTAIEMRKAKFTEYYSKDGGLTEQSTDAHKLAYKLWENAGNAAHQALETLKEFDLIHLKWDFSNKLDKQNATTLKQERIKLLIEFESTKVNSAAKNDKLTNYAYVSLKNFDYKHPTSLSEALYI